MKSGRIKKYLKTGVELKLFFKKKNQSFENYLKIEILKIKYKIGILENYLKMEVLKIRILKNYLRMEFF